MSQQKQNEPKTTTITPPSVDVNDREAVAELARKAAMPLPVSRSIEQATDEARKFCEATPLERLRILNDQMESIHKNAGPLSILRFFVRGQMIATTVDLKEHPEWYRHDCLCAECRSNW